MGHAFGGQLRQLLGEAASPAATLAEALAEAGVLDRRDDR